MHKIYMQEAEIVMSRLEDMLLLNPDNNTDLRALLISISHLLRKMLEIDEQA